MGSRDDADDELDLAALSVPALIRLARAIDDDEDDPQRYWAYVHELQRRADDETVEAAERLTRGSERYERVLGADVLAQIGIQPRAAGIRARAAARLHELLLADTDADVLQAAISGLGRQSARETLHDVVPFAMHHDPELRKAVACAFPGLTGWGRLNELARDDARLAIGTLVALSEDEDGEVRNWALFALARQYEVDTPELRDLFVRHLDDEHEEAREEAMAGLARRRDPRALEPVLAALAPDVATRVAVEAAAHLADDRLTASLEELADDGWGDDELLRDALRACDPVQRVRWEMLGDAVAAALRDELRAHVGEGRFEVEVGREALEYLPRLEATWTAGDGRELGMLFDLPQLVDGLLDGDLDRAAQLFRDTIELHERDG